MINAPRRRAPARQAHRDWLRKHFRQGDHRRQEQCEKDRATQNSSAKAHTAQGWTSPSRLADMAKTSTDLHRGDPTGASSRCRTSRNAQPSTSQPRRRAAVAAQSARDDAGHRRPFRDVGGSTCSMAWSARNENLTRPEPTVARRFHALVDSNGDEDDPADRCRRRAPHRRSSRCAGSRRRPSPTRSMPSAPGRCRRRSCSIPPT